ncbi:hypothetical protein KZY42_004297 [Vibrio vulnificus]|nr:hypothetical protein [Vibrio vulnificus]
MAFLACGDLSGENGLREIGLGGIRPLTRRYVYLKFKGLNVLGSSSLSLGQFVPSRLSKPALSA